MEQLKATSALEPFIILSSSATSPRAAADLVTQATSAPHTYVFAELLQTPNIRALQSSKEYSNYLTLLEVFSWGTWGDYKSTPNLPELSPAQRQKLLLLSLLPLARQSSPLTYSTVQTALSLPSPQALESLVTTAMYANLLHGTLDPHRQVVHITAIAPLRDLAPGSLPRLAAALDAWSARCDVTLADLQADVDAVDRKAHAAAERNRRVKRLFDERVAAAAAAATAATTATAASSSSVAPSSSATAMAPSTSELESGKGKRALDGKHGDGEDEDGLPDPMDVDGESSRLRSSKRTILGLGRRSHT